MMITVSFVLLRSDYGRNFLQTNKLLTDADFSYLKLYLISSFRIFKLVDLKCLKRARSDKFLANCKYFENSKLAMSMMTPNKINLGHLPRP